MAFGYPSLYGSEPPVSTRITVSLPPGPHFLRPACPYPGCQLSSFTGSCPMDNIPADYWLIRYNSLPTPASILQHLSVGVSCWISSFVVLLQILVTCLRPEPNCRDLLQLPGSGRKQKLHGTEPAAQAASGLRISPIIFAGL